MAPYDFPNAENADGISVIKMECHKMYISKVRLYN